MNLLFAIAFFFTLSNNVLIGNAIVTQMMLF